MRQKPENKIIFYGLCVLFMFLPILLFYKSESEAFLNPVQTDVIKASETDGGPDSTMTYSPPLIVSGEPETVDSRKSFSIVVMPDTQKYARFYPEIFCNQTEWIAANVSKLNISLTLQLGDIIDSGAKSVTEWEVAERCMTKLSGVVPWSVVPGNHDIDVKNKKSSGFSMYDKYFPTSLFNKFSWYKDNYKNNQSSFLWIDSLGMKIGVINLSVEPDDDVLKWAAKKIQDNSQAYFIVVTHKYLLDDGKRDNYQSFGKGGNTGEKIWQKLIRSNCDVKLVLSGHFHKIDGEANIVSKNNCKDDVIQVMQDYQNRELGGNGLLRIYTFIPSEHKVQVKTYSPYTKTFEVDSDSQFEFSL